MTNEPAMLHLAQVKKNTTSGDTELHLLAHQTSESSWELNSLEILPLTGDKIFNENILVLVELADDREIVSIKEAKDWILNLLQQLVSKTRSGSQLVEEEREKIEQWRQEIVSQGLELSRRSLEVETHREQLQELEQTLKQDREKLTEEQKQLQDLKAKIGQE
jgi:chromosome segregation ATPase